ncbi:MAG: phosphate acyltransferase PlsX [Anaerolineaceae bacterium 4572_78]|nr:MAG: phosphate acyltransferase PlsX [Anaerolineaceae bacterium 4572_78]
MIITLDAMGGDTAPQSTVYGAVWAARDFGIAIQLVGKPNRIATELAKHDTQGLDLQIIPASEVIEMEDSPAESVRSKKDASVNVGVRQVKTGKSHAFVSAGNSGGTFVASLFGLGRIKGIKRPALTTAYPTRSAHRICFLIDVGANADVKPEYLVQFGLMGSLYTEKVLGIPNPRVGLVSNGEEKDKGSKIIKEAYKLMNLAPFNFIGNIEGKDIPAGLADVIVTDGFTGNVIVKLSEGLPKGIMETIADDFKTPTTLIVGGALITTTVVAMYRTKIFGLTALLSGLLTWRKINEIKKRFDYREFGGGALLGVDGVVIVTHGRADAYTIRNAIRAAKQAVENDIVNTIKEYL